MLGPGGGRIAESRREGVWPRIYRIRRGQRLFLGGLGLTAIVGGLFGAGAIVLSRSSPAVALIPILFVGLGTYLLAVVAAERLVLYEDAIQFVEFGRSKRRVRRDEIVGLRMVPLQYGFLQAVFELRAARKRLKVTWGYETDQILQAWLAAIPNLDVEERARAEAELLGSAALGPSHVARSRALTGARRVARVLNGISIATCAWGWVYPRPYNVAIGTLFVLPLVGVSVLVGGRGRYSFDTRRNDPRPSLGTTVMGPGLILALRALLDVQVLDWKPFLVGGAVGGIGLSIVIALAERGHARKLWVLFLLAPLLSGYPWGAISLANALFDRGSPQVFRVAVVDKYTSSGKHTSWNLKLDRWGPVTERKSVDVGRRFYALVSVGDDVCVALRPGALGARWYVIQSCRGE